MTNKTTKRALSTSVISLIICVVMLMGTTFAWFTDSVTSGRNTIVAGNLDVELEYWNGTEWNTVKDATNLFTGNLWEPGHTEVVYLKVANVGTLALKYRLGINIFAETGSVSVEGNSFKLSDYIQFGVVEGVNGENAAFAKRTDAVAAVTTATPIGNGYMSEEKLMEADADDAYAALVVYMPETVGNEANYAKGADVPTIDLGISLVATQMVDESDSFGTNYDENALYPGFPMTVDGGSIDAPVALEDTIAAIPEGVEDVTIYVNGAVSWTTGATHGSTPFSDGTVKNITIIGAGSDATLVALGSGVGPIRTGNGGTLTLKDITVVDQSVSYAESAWEFGYLEFGYNEDDVLVFENVDFVNAIMVSGNSTFTDCTFNSNNENEYDVWVNSGSATFTDCTFTGYRGLKIHEDYDTEISSVTAESCLFGPLSVKPGIAIGDVNADTTVTLKNNTFANTQPGDQGNYKYESDTNLSTFTFVEENSIIATYYNVDDKTELASVLSGAGAAGAGNTVISINSDLDMTGIVWTPVNVDGYKGADVVTVEGNGNTITNLSAPLFAGGFAGESGIIIKDLTISDSDIKTTNSQGAGAFIECVDSMETITLTNCHLENSSIIVDGESRVGGLIGWTSGYSNQNDGPVKTNVTITDCSVIGCELKAFGSVGGIIGHAGASDWTYHTITNCTVKDTKLTSTDDGSWRVGVVVGTANIGEVTVNGLTSSGNTVEQTGKTAPTGTYRDLYGRLALGTTGKLTIDGTAITE